MDGFTTTGGTAVTDEPRDGDDGPVGKLVICPECDANTHAIVPTNARLVDCEENADGKVWADCLECGDRFLVHYRDGSADR